MSTAANTMADAVQAAARAHAHQASLVLQQGEVLGVNPLQIELHGADITLDDDIIDQSQEVIRYNKDDKLKAGDIVTVSQIMGDWRVISVHAPDTEPKTISAVEDRVSVLESVGVGAVRAQDEGADLPVRGRLNFLGAGITVVDDAANGRVNISVPSATNTQEGTTRLSIPPAGPPIALGANDPAVTNARTPTGAASGHLTGTYPGPTIANGVITDSHVATIYKDGTPGTLSWRTLGAGANQAAPGDDPRFGTHIYVESFPRLAGETEDAPRVNRAITAAPARGAVLIYGAFDYIINSGIVTPADKPIRHQGAGMPVGDGGTSTNTGGTRLVRTSGTTTIFTCLGTGIGSGQRGMIELRDIGINGGGLAGIGADIARASNIWLDRVSIRSCVHTGLRMREVYNSGAGSLWISGCGAGSTNPAMVLDAFVGSSQGGVDTFSFAHVELEGNAGTDLVLTGEPGGAGPTTNVSFGYLKFEGGWLAAAGCPYIDLRYVQSIHIARLNIAVHGNTAPEARTVTPFQMGSVGSSSAPCSIGSLQIGNTQAVDTPYVLQISRGALQIDSFAASGFAGHLATTALIRLESTAGNDFQVGQVSTNFTALPIFSDARSGGSQTTRTGAVKMRSQGVLNAPLWESRLGVNAQNAWSLKADGWQDFGDGIVAPDVGHGRLTTAMWALVTGGVERLRVNGSGNFGLGVPLSPWTAGLSPSIEYTDTAISFGDDTDFHLTSNAYFDGAWKYKTTDLGANYFMNKGTHTFRVAPSGTVDTAVTWTTRFAIDQTGLGFFGVTPVARPGATTDLKVGLAALGLLTAGGASPLNLEGGQMTAGGGYRLGAALTGAAYQAQQVAGQPVLQNLLLGTDTKPAFRILGEGTHAWGIGGTTDPDVSAYRQTSGGVSLQIDASGTGASLMLRNTNAAGYSGIEYRDYTGAAKMFSGYSNVSPNHFRFNAVGTPLRFMYSTTTRLELDSTGLGFFGGTPVAKPTVTGSRGGNAAVASLLTALANLGLITDSSSA